MELYKNFSVDELFTPIRGKGKYTRGFAEKNPGEFPVYSASLSAPLCFINHYDYDGTFLTWTTNGYGGRIQIISGKFSINGDRGILIPLKKSLPNPSYIKRYLEPILVSQAVGRVVDGKKNEYTKVSPEVVAASIITLPTTEMGDIDLSIIENTAIKINALDNIQDSLKKYHDQIEDAEVIIDLKMPYKTILLSDKEHFTLSIGDRVLKKDSLEEGIPVYSANVNYSFAFIKRSNLSNFDKPSILWGIDGVFSWNILPENYTFASTDHCGRLQIISNNLDPYYVFYYLQSTRLEYGFDRVFRANLENIKSLVEIKVPVDNNGNISLQKQKEFANRYRKINLLKAQLIDKLDMLSNVRIEIPA